VVQQELVLKPCVDGTACKDEHSHGKGMLKWFAEIEANIVATAESKRPEARGRVAVCEKGAHFRLLSCRPQRSRCAMCNRVDVSLPLQLLLLLLHEHKHSRLCRCCWLW
jgi:hypothetical protein